jgi:inner membrane protein
LLLAAAGYAALAARPVPTPLGTLGVPLPGGGGLEGVPLALVAGAVLAGLGGLAPDVDRAGSSVARSLGPPSRMAAWVVQRGLGHRGPLHSLAAVLLVFVLGEAAGAGAGTTNVGAALAFGWASHLLLDALTPAGVPLLWPLPARLRLPPGVTTGGLLEQVVVALGLLLCLAWASGSPWVAQVVV